VTDQAWQATRFGGPEVLDLLEIDLGRPGPGEGSRVVRAFNHGPPS
jgi:hypothetical protein